MLLEKFAIKPMEPQVSNSPPVSEIAVELVVACHCPACLQLSMLLFAYHQLRIGYSL